MKNITIILLVSLFSNTIIAQAKVAVIDFQKVLNNSQIKFEFNYAYAEIDSLVTQLGREQIAIYQENLTDIIKKIQSGCASVEEIKRMEEEAKRQEVKLLALDKFHTDTLAFFRQNLDYEVTKIIQSEIKEYCKYSNLYFYGDSNKPYVCITNCTMEGTYI